MDTKLTITPIKGIPLVNPGDNLAILIGEALRRDGSDLLDGDILVVAQKVISKAEGRQIALQAVKPSLEAEKLAREVNKDPRLVELILRESTEVVRKVPGVIIVRHRLGYVMANAGIDQSNVDHADGDCALLLPEDPDLSARRLRESLREITGTQLGIIISDSANRPWRLGTVGYTIGSSGITVLDDRRGKSDLFGHTLKVTMSNRADAIAAAATLVMGETTESIPVAIVRGFPTEDSEEIAADCIRPREEDLFL